MIFNTYEELKNKVPNLVLKIWWEWNDIFKYKNKYEENKNIIFLWKVDITKIIENLEQANLFLFPSKIDSFWLVIIESMSIWVPVISYNLSWAKELVQNNINWYLVDSDSEFIKKSYEILSNSSLEKKLSKEAIKTSVAFTKQSFENQLSKIL
jgi:glycosyltransferase involved in cell wall biosynthesis